MALELVGRMSKAGLDFVFKGGTSLVLLIDPIQRLSIDVDIICTEPLDRLIEVLSLVAVNHQPFLTWEHQEARDRESPPTKHFRIIHSSHVSKQTEPSIQLDVLIEDHPYEQIVERPVALD